MQQASERDTARRLCTNCNGKRVVVVSSVKNGERVVPCGVCRGTGVAGYITK